MSSTLGNTPPRSRPSRNLFHNGQSARFLVNEAETKITSPTVQCGFFALSIPFRSVDNIILKTASNVRMASPWCHVSQAGPWMSLLILSFILLLQQQLSGRKSNTLLPASPYSFQPTAVETLEPINESAVDFLRELGRRTRISSKFQAERQTAYLFRRLSVTV